MSCYFRHMKGVFADAGIEVTASNKKVLDRLIHGIMGIECKNCPETWRALKDGVLSSEARRNDFIAKLKNGAKDF